MFQQSPVHRRRFTRPAIVTFTAVGLITAACGSSPAEPVDVAAPTTATETTATEATDPARQAPASDVEEVDEPRPRLLIADDAGRVDVVDIASGESLETLDLDHASRVTAAGRYVVVTQRDANQLRAIDPGTWSDGHGDHGHFFVSAPLSIDHTRPAAEPTHVVTDGDLVTVFNDGDGSVVVLDAHDLTAPPAFEYDTGGAHHGVAIALADHPWLITSVPTDGEALPDGIRVVDTNTSDTVVESDACPGLHGEIRNADRVLFGCSDGVLAVDLTTTPPSISHIAKPGATAAEDRTGSFVGDHTSTVAFGGLGTNALAVVDTEAASARRVDLPSPMASFGYDPETGTAVVLSIDGHLRRFGADGTMIDDTAVLAAFEPAVGHGGPPVPSIVVGAGFVFVADPATKSVAAWPAATSTPTFTVDLGGAPASMVVIDPATS